MLGIYFSGTGNTKYCLERFLDYYDGSEPISIENSDAIETIRKSQNIVLWYPIYYSNIPKIVKEFIYQNRAGLKNKEIFIICTMGLFSGDGSGCGARLLKKCGTNIVGGLHLKMWDCIGDLKLLKKSLSQNKQLVKNAKIKIANGVDALKRGKPTKDGLNILDHVVGLLGQRLWFYRKTKEYTNKLKIDNSMCICCGKCVTLSLLLNIYLLLTLLLLKYHR